MRVRWQCAPPCFKVKYKRRDLRLFRTPAGDVMYSFEYLCREAARWSNHTYTSFCRLPVEEQAAVIAHYQTFHKLEYLMTRDANRKQSS